MKWSEWVAVVACSAAGFYLFLLVVGFAGILAGRPDNTASEIAMQSFEMVKGVVK